MYRIDREQGEPAALRARHPSLERLASEARPMLGCTRFCPWGNPKLGNLNDQVDHRQFANWSANGRPRPGTRPNELPPNPAPQPGPSATSQGRPVLKPKGSPHGGCLRLRPKNGPQAGRLSRLCLKEPLAPGSEHAVQSALPLAVTQERQTPTRGASRRCLKSHSPRAGLLKAFSITLCMLGITKFQIPPPTPRDNR